ncbi:hypothetical protein [Saccharibacillus alkalitolerans]|uniref:Uncharacterized protein n=1 Tax=Saccharibacillus alkalitolerans TaxID=2705290 RepID=A0ABX0F2L6_9BACL|nr:hypothetical protein [Saccharibacillus alkalitolerans]NGZ75231.1 hypothetical protein [Saccharibacillus alkalitolerans]
MRMTCFDDGYWPMGHIYLMPPTHRSTLEGLAGDILGHVPAERLHIPHIAEPAEDPAPKLDRMKIAKLTYKQDFCKGYDTLYGNDMDENGYITGIELNLTAKRMIELVNRQVFRVIDVRWKSRLFRLLTLDDSEKVFDERNILYRMSDREDVFVIAALSAHEIPDLSEKARQDPVGIPIIRFLGLLSSRDDLYPPEYLLKPDFYLQIDPPDSQ